MTKPTTTTGRSGHSAVLAVACVAQFMVVLDVSIVNVALPSIRTSLDMSATALQWIVNAYTITFAGFLLLGGRLADLFGRKRLFITGLGLFTLASLVGGFAQDSWQLLLARGGQGIGGAVLAPATLTLLATTFTEPRERARAFGIWGAVAGAGGTFGGLVGGVLTDSLSWRWILFVNVPIGIALIAAAAAKVTELRHDRSGRGLDLLGALSVTGGIMAVVYGIVRTESEGWSDAGTIASLVVGVVLLALFVLDQAKIAKDPLVPLRIFSNRSVSAANMLLVVVGAGMFSSFYFLSLYMQQVRHFSPTKAGLAFLPMGLGIIFAARAAAKLVHRFGPRVLLFVGLSLATLGSGLLTQLSVDGDYWLTIALPIAIMGIGMGFNMASVTIAGTAGVQRHEAGLASGLLNTSRQLGGALGLAALTTIAADRTKDLLVHGAATPQAVQEALTKGFARGFGAGAVLLGIGVVTTLLTPSRASLHAPAPSGPSSKAVDEAAVEIADEGLEPA